MFGQVGFFNKFAGKEDEDKRPLQRYANESKRLLGVLDGRLAGRAWIMGDDYTIADIATLGWVNNLVTSTRRVSWWGPTASATSRPGSNADWPARRCSEIGRAHV